MQVKARSGSRSSGLSRQLTSLRRSTCSRGDLVTVKSNIGRREIIKNGLLISASVWLNVGSSSARGLDRYIRKKALDGLDTYVPLALVARQQLEDARKVMEVDVKAARALLRSGAFNGLRENIRAIGEYAALNQKEVNASQLVGSFFSTLDSYDRLLYEAVQREKTAATAEGSTVLDVQEAEKRWNATLVALDNLLQTVPEDVMKRSKLILASTNSEEEGPSRSDGSAAEDDKLLKSLLF
ncbi:hypothetical protein CEUSTIGMA_g12009.t1 [Chlamydomonas eustigma]|uniref:DUF7880 domain-containing protein n=1 Tax=Chlamydomonas eustigma TaxID=1157962 RepID=A0A250XNE3_9CHLO|nr:hypothetical protein CEUSTIGMA_g12009.t1 [Chlamydomonas eustigma]|eukprot:GAX84588.1 hypothetical protein CEUSTIGMA_g12009.t1 [Chlamydomonas eustigma]